MSWINEIPVLPGSLIIEPQFFLFHYLDVVLLVGVLPLFVEVDQFLVHQPIEQLEILEIFLSLAGFPEPILSSADVVQHILDVVVAKRLPRVLLEDSDLYVGRKLAHPAHLLLMLLPLPFFSLIVESLICFLFEMPNMYLHIFIARYIISCQRTDNILPRKRSVLMSGSELLFLLTKHSSSSRFALDVQSFTCSLSNLLSSYLRSKKNFW